MAIGVFSPASGPSPSRKVGPGPDSPTPAAGAPLSALPTAGQHGSARVENRRYARRDRRGRGMRGRLVPASVPLSRTRSEVFDDLVLEAVDEIEERAKRSLGGIEFAVEDVPPPLPTYDANVLEDGDVPLARLMPATSAKVLPRVVVYRWPLEARAHSRDELCDLITEVVAEQVANLLGLDPEELTD